MVSSISQMSSYFSSRLHGLASRYNHSVHIRAVTRYLFKAVEAISILPISE